MRWIRDHRGIPALPVVLLASSMGVWLFYVQHQFDRVVWFRGDDWSLQEAALQGSSHYDLPAILRWFTANIGVHHVHHLSSRIPFYRLRQVLRDHPELQNVGRLTLWRSLLTMRLALWDEASQKLISFGEMLDTLRNTHAAEAAIAQAAAFMSTAFASA